MNTNNIFDIISNIKKLAHLVDEDDVLTVINGIPAGMALLEKKENSEVLSDHEMTISFPTKDKEHEMRVVVLIDDPLDYTVKRLMYVSYTGYTVIIKKGIFPETDMIEYLSLISMIAKEISNLLKAYVPSTLSFGEVMVLHEHLDYDRQPYVDISMKVAPVLSYVTEILLDKIPSSYLDIPKSHKSKKEAIENIASLIDKIDGLPNLSQYDEEIDRRLEELERRLDNIINQNAL